MSEDTIDKTVGKLPKTEPRFITIGVVLILASFACVSGTLTPGPTPTLTTIPSPIQTKPLSPFPTVRFGPLPSEELNIILQRLDVQYLGQDGHRVIGSGCPGNDAGGSIDNYHFVISGVDQYRTVQRVVVMGDNSTLTWAWPCSDTWGLVAENIDEGVWDVFIAPSSPTEIYTVLFFYEDYSLAAGMIEAR